MHIYNSRWEFISPFVVGKKVLDIGPAELFGTTSKHKEERWIHGKIKKVASSLTGLEHSATQVEALQAKGFNILQGEAENFELRDTFEVVVAGEVIEHLSNPGNFLECAKRHLLPGGKLVLTTPNRFNLLVIVQIIKSGKVPDYEKDIAKHVLYFDEPAMKAILQRHGFSDIKIEYCRWVGQPGKGVGKFLTKTLGKWRPALLSTLVVSATKGVHG